MKTVTHWCAAVLSLGVLTACGADSTAPAPQVSRIELRHATRVVFVNEVTSIEAFTYAEGSRRLIVHRLSWTSDDPATATVDSLGLVTGRGIGLVTIRASLGNVESSIRLDIRAASLSIEPVTASPHLVVGATTILRAQYRDLMGQAIPHPGSFTWTTGEPHRVSLKPVPGLDSYHVEVTGLAAGLASIVGGAGDMVRSHIVGVVSAAEPPNPPLRVRDFYFFPFWDFYSFVPTMEVTVEPGRSVEVVRIEVAIPGRGAAWFPPLCTSARLGGGQHALLGESSYPYEAHYQISIVPPTGDAGVALLTYRTEDGGLFSTVVRGMLDHWGFAIGYQSTVPWEVCDNAR